MTVNLPVSSSSSSYPLAEIGLDAQRLLAASDKGIRLAPTAVVPISSLKEIADHNQLWSKIKEYRSHLDAGDEYQQQVLLQKVRQHVRHLLIPQHIQAFIRQIYHQQLGGGHVTLRSSWLTPSSRSQSPHFAQGDANLLESVLELWAQMITAAQTEQDVFPGAVLVQRHPNCRASGILYTTNPHSHNKRQMLLESTWGIYQTGDSSPDTFTYDIRTQQIVSQQSHPKTTLWHQHQDELVKKNVPPSQQKIFSLTNREVQQLMEWGILLNRASLEQLQLQWYLDDHQLYLSAVNILPTVLAHQAVESHCLVLGDSLIGGYVAGECQVNPELTAFETGHILVAPELTKRHQALIRHASAIVSEQPIHDSLILQLIKHYHIPTITGAALATRKLHANQAVIVDASGGKVLKPDAKSTHRVQTLTKVGAIISNPYLELPTGADSFYFKSDFALQFNNLNPVRLIQSKEARVLADILSKKLQAMLPHTLWYRLSSVPDEEEPNPGLGSRGALKHLADPMVLEYETEIIKRTLNQSSAKLNIVLPLARTPAEKELLLLQLEKLLGKHRHQTEIWLEVTTPHHVLQLSSFLSSKIKGLVLSLETLHALWYGYDWQNPQVSKQYPLDQVFIETVMSQLAAYKLPLVIEYHRPQQQLLSPLMQQKVSQLVTRAQSLTSLKTQLKKIEERHITNGSN